MLNFSIIRFLIHICLCIILQSCSSYTTIGKRGSSAKIITYNKQLLHKCHNNKNIVLVGGCFDLLHYGHIRFLYESKMLGNYLIVALEPDISIINYKNRVPVHNQQQRAESLSNLRAVDEVVMLPELKGFNDYSKLVQDVCPAVIAVTRNDPQISNKRRQAELVGAKLVEVTDLLVSPFVGGALSSTAIIKKLGAEQ